jgi:hypothetical protein
MTLKMAEFAPIPSAKAMMAVPVAQGVLVRSRTACWRSRRKVDIDASSFRGDGFAVDKVPDKKERTVPTQETGTAQTAPLFLETMN